MLSKVLVTGITGLLGRALRTELPTGDIEVVGTGLTRAQGDVRRLDLLDTASVEELFAAEKPDVVIHAAAERRPDVSQADPDGTRQLNIDATGTVADAAKKVGAWVLYLSTDYVFDGENPPYAVDAKPNPLNFYGETKLAGEHVALREPENLVLRVPLLFGAVENLDESPVTILAKGLGDAPSANCDHWQIRYPTFTNDVAVTCRGIIERRCDNDDPRGDCLRGVVHWSGDEAMTKYDMTRTICELWDLPSDGLVPVSTPPCGAPRPQNTELDCSILEGLGTGQRTPFREALEPILRPYR